MRIKNFSKTARTLLKPLIYVAVFWIFTDILPGTLFKAGPVSKLIASFGFYIAYHIGLFILNFFRLRSNVIARFMMSSATTTGYLLAVDKFMPDILDLNKTYVGNTDFVLFKIPQLFEITDIYFICIFCAIILVLCCIIIEVSIKRT